MGGTAFRAGTTDFYLVELSTSGQIIGQINPYHFGADEFCQSIIARREGGIVLAGSTNDSDFTLVTLDDQLRGEFGVPDRIKVKDGYSINQAFDVFQTRDGGYVMVGITAQNGNTSEIAVVKLDYRGNVF